METAKIDTPISAVSSDSKTSPSEDTINLVLPDYLTVQKIREDFEEYYDSIRDRGVTKEKFLQDIANTIKSNIDIIVAFSDPKVQEFPEWFDEDDTPYEAVTQRDELLIDYRQRLKDTYIIDSSTVLDEIIQTILDYIEENYDSQIPDAFRDQTE